MPFHHPSLILEPHQNWHWWFCLSPSLVFFWFKHQVFLEQIFCRVHEPNNEPPLDGRKEKSESFSSAILLESPKVFHFPVFSQPPCWCSMAQKAFIRFPFFSPSLFFSNETVSGITFSLFFAPGTGVQSKLLCLSFSAVPAISLCQKLDQSTAPACEVLLSPVPFLPGPIAPHLWTATTTTEQTEKKDDPKKTKNNSAHGFRPRMFECYGLGQAKTSQRHQHTKKRSLQKKLAITVAIPPPPKSPPKKSGCVHFYTHMLPSFLHLLRSVPPNTHNESIATTAPLF